MNVTLIWDESVPATKLTDVEAIWTPLHRPLHPQDSKTCVLMAPEAEEISWSYWGVQEIVAADG